MDLRRALPWLEPLLVGAGGLAVGAALYWPLPTQLGARVPTTLFTDGHLVALGVGADQLPRLLTTTRLGWPMESSFRPLLWPAIVAARLWGPVTAVGLAFLATPAVNALAGWLAARLLDLRPAARALVAVLCTINLWNYTTLANGQVEQAGVGGVALVWASVLAAARRPALVPVAGLVLLAFGVAAPHVALVALVGLGMLGPLAVLTEPGWGWTTLRLAASGAVLGLAGWLVAAYHGGTVGNRESVFFPKGIAVNPARWQFETASAADLWHTPIVPTILRDAVAHTAYLGWVATGAALLGLIRRRGWGLVVVALGLLVSATGPTLPGTSWPTPMQALIRLSPGLQASLNPYRAAMGVIAATALLAGLGADRRWGWLLALVVSAGQLAEWRIQARRGFPLPLREVGYEVYAGRLRDGAGPVLELPVFDHDCDWATYTPAVQAVAYHRPIYSLLRPSPDTNAYGRNAPTFRALHDTFLAADTCASALPALVTALAPSTVVVHDHVRCGTPIDYDGCLTAVYGTAETDGRHHWWNLPR